ncbi:MAG: HAD-IB family phosphatase [Magnetococcus sp. YQC-3]
MARQLTGGERGVSHHILCDFDGTIVRDDVTDALLERFALPEWRALEEEWQAGRIGSRACMSGQVALLRVMPAELDRFLDRIEIDPDFSSFVGHAHRLGWKVTVVSDGVDYAIRRILNRHGLGHLPVFANHLEHLDGECYRLSFPHANPDCLPLSGTCKCHVARQSGSMHILIGDGASDFCAASVVQMVWAKAALLRHCRERGLPHRPFTCFSDCLELLLSTGAALPQAGLPLPTRRTGTG